MNFPQNSQLSCPRVKSPIKIIFEMFSTFQIAPNMICYQWVTHFKQENPNIGSLEWISYLPFLLLENEEEKMEI